jgi:hypothetical protein
VTRPWLPRVFRGADEFCNDSIGVIGLLVGMLVVFWRPGRLRTEADGPCTACLAADEEARAEGWAVVR